MRTGMARAVIEAKLWSDNIVVTHVLRAPKYVANALPKEDWIDLFNAWLETFYADDPNVTLFDINSVLDATPYPNGDYGLDDLHILASGNTKMAILLNNTISQPWGRSFEHVITTDAQAPIVNAPGLSTTGVLVTMGVDATVLVALGDMEERSVLTAANDIGIGQAKYLPVVSLFSSFFADDGANLSGRVLDWKKGDEVLILCQTLLVGEDYKYRGGYSVNGGAILWDETPNDYVGDFNPLSRLRLAYEMPDPLWIKQIQVWDRVATDTEILELASKYV
jgi:hypothetical protein